MNWQTAANTRFVAMALDKDKVFSIFVQRHCTNPNVVAHSLMKYFTLLILVTMTLFHCTRTKTKLPDNVKIIAKYKVWDEFKSPDFVNCSDDIDVKSFREIEMNDCSFHLDNKIFDLREKYIIDDNGNLKEYMIYKSEGPLTYSIDELKADMKFYKLIKADIFTVRLLNSNMLVDSGDTLEIEKVLSTDKVIFVKRDNESIKNNTRLLYVFN